MKMTSKITMLHIEKIFYKFSGAEDLEYFKSKWLYYWFFKGEYDIIINNDIISDYNFNTWKKWEGP
jgi:hypothetical protein